MVLDRSNRYSVPYPAMTIKIHISGPEDLTSNKCNVMQNTFCECTSEK